MHATLLVGGTMVELDPLRVERADVILLEDRIGHMDTQIPTTSTVDCSNCLVMPGLVVAHSHIYSALAAGMPPPGAPPSTFREILERVWWRLDRAVDAESLRVSAEIAAISAVRAGVTCLIDHHESPSFIDGALEPIDEGLREIGVRGVLCYGATDRHGADGALAGLRESERFARKSAKDPMIRGMIGVHAPFTASDATLEGAASAAARVGCGVHLHVAEGPDDQRAAAERWKTPVVSHLARAGLVGERSILAHAVQISTEEAALIRERRAWVTHQARSNMNNGVGYAAQLTSLDRVALGTDGIDNDIFAELRAAFFRRREHLGPSAWPDPTAMLANGHRLAGELFGERMGSLARGAPADVIVLSYDPPTPLDERTFGAHLLFGIGSLHVRDVFIAGRAVMRNRRIIGIDEKSVYSRARELATKLWSRMPSA